MESLQVDGEKRIFLVTLLYKVSCGAGYFSQGRGSLGRKLVATSLLKERLNHQVGSVAAGALKWSLRMEEILRGRGSAQGYSGRLLGIRL